MSAFWSRLTAMRKGSSVGSSFSNHIIRPLEAPVRSEPDGTGQTAKMR